MTGPRTTKEALIAEMLGDLDRLLTRAEVLPVTIQDAESRIAGMIARLNEAGDRFRLAVTSFSEEARTGLSDYAQRKVVEAGARAADEVHAAMAEAALLAFRSEASDKAAVLSLELAEAAREFRRSMWARLWEHGMVAITAALLTAMLFLWLLR